MSGENWSVNGDAFREREGRNMEAERDADRWDRFAEPAPTEPGLVVTCPVCHVAGVEVWAGQRYVHRFEPVCSCSVSALVDREGYRGALLSAWRRAGADRIRLAAETMIEMEVVHASL